MRVWRISLILVLAAGLGLETSGAGVEFTLHVEDLTTPPTAAFVAGP